VASSHERWRASCQAAHVERGGADAQRGFLSGGYGEDELARAGAFRVYRDTSELRE
jgi:hypothetical protein